MLRLIEASALGLIELLPLICPNKLVEGVTEGVRVAERDKLTDTLPLCEILLVKLASAD